MPCFIALLRGINVGGNNMIPMAQLREMFSRAGFEQHKTHLQSGNVVFLADTQAPAALETLLEQRTAEAFNLKIDFVVRTSHEWDQVIARNPFKDHAKNDPGHVLVLFLKKDIDPSSVEEQMRGYEGPEIVHPTPRHLYVYYGEGVGQSKLGKTLKPGVSATGRNWNTVLKLASLARDLAP